MWSGFMAADELSAVEQTVVELLRAAQYQVQYRPEKFTAWHVSFGMSHGTGRGLRIALKHCFWTSNPLANAQPGSGIWAAREVAIKSMKLLDLENCNGTSRERPHQSLLRLNNSRFSI